MIDKGLFVPLSVLMSEEKAAKQETGCRGSKACCEPIAWKDLALSITAVWFWIQDLMDQEGSVAGKRSEGSRRAQSCVLHK